MKTQKEKVPVLYRLSLSLALLLVAVILAVALWGIVKTLYPNFELSDLWPWKKKPVPIEIVREVKLYENSEDFVLSVAAMADAKVIFPPTTVGLGKDEEVIGCDDREANIDAFPTEWEFTELKPVLKEFPLTVIDDVGLLVEHYGMNYYFFTENYKPGDKFKVSPGPKWKIEYCEKIYLVGQDKKLWNSRK